MITIKLPIKLEQSDRNILTKYRRCQSSVVRHAYNCCHKDMADETVIRNNCKNFKNTNLPVYLITCGIKDGKQNYQTEQKLKKIEQKELENKIVKFENKKKLSQKQFRKLSRLKLKLFKLTNRKIIFGGRKNWYDYQKGLITKEEFKENRLRPLIIQGQKAYKGNRHIRLDIIENNRILIKIKTEDKFYINLPKLKSSNKIQLHKLEELCKENKSKYTVRLTDGYICIIFEEIIDKVDYNSKSNRVLGIDLNPENIGISVVEFDKKDNFKVLNKTVIDLTELNECSIGKKHFELFEINKRIINTAKSFNCGKLSMEDLSIRTSDLGKGKIINKLCNNDWLRDKLVQNLEKRCKLNNIEFVEVHPAYSSFVGNLNYGDDTTSDMVASSIEIARRGYKKYEKGWFYPRLINVKDLPNHWKKEVNLSYSTWKELFNIIKKSKMLYRFPLDFEKSSMVFSNYSMKSRVKLYNFIKE